MEYRFSSVVHTMHCLDLLWRRVAHQKSIGTKKQ
jgi:hypothetical protein